MLYNTLYTQLFMLHSQGYSIQCMLNNTYRQQSRCSAPWHPRRNHQQCNWPTYSLSSRFLVVFKRHYWLRLARLKMTLVSRCLTRTWNVSLLRLRTLALYCQDCARRMPASIIQSTDNPQWQDSYIVFAWTTRRQEASLLRGSVACCRLILWSRHWQAQVATCWLSPSARTTVPVIKDTCFLCLVNDKSI